MSSQTVNKDFKAQLREKAEFVNKLLRQTLAKQVDINRDLLEAIEYAMEGKGKRIRAAIVLWCCEIVSGETNRDAETAAMAIEMVHTYSLLHDDLPAMDDDDLRRGRATCHKAFDEATAILAGDGLLTLAFDILAKDVEEPAVAIRLIRELADAAGPAGMIAGQMADLKGEKKKGSEEFLEYIHTNKTAKMFACAAMMGGIAGGADEERISCLGRYGLKLGLGFQIADDILDVSASSEQLGKTAGKDAKARKCTYPAIIGLEESRELERKLANEAIAALEPFDSKADILVQLAENLVKRTK